MSFGQRLGFATGERLLIVNCDDLGVSHAANLATLRAMTDGIASSATLMVPCPWAREAARLFAGHPIGIHLTVTCEYEGYRWRGLTRGASLHDAEGFLPRTTAVALERLDAADARAECQAQIEAALGWGVDVTHLDAHMGVMLARADLFEAYLDLAAHFRLPVRIGPEEESAKRGIAARARAAARGVLCNDHMLEPWDQPMRTLLSEAVPHLPPGVTDIFAHPAFDGEELRGYDTRNHHIRTHDAECLVDPEMRRLLDAHGIRRISYREIREAQRAGKTSMLNF